MRIPSSIKIGGITYKVEIKDLGDDMGKTTFDKSLISIDEKLNQEQREATFYHEVIHCINNQLTEMEVEFLAQSIYQIIKDNYEKRNTKTNRSKEGIKISK